MGAAFPSKILRAPRRNLRPRLEKSNGGLAKSSPRIPISRAPSGGSVFSRPGWMGGPTGISGHRRIGGRNYPEARLPGPKTHHTSENPLTGNTYDEKDNYFTS